MRVVCAYCQGVVREDGVPSAAGTSHGMCPACSEHFAKLSEGMSLSEYLESMPDPILVVDEAGRVLGANQKVAALFGRERVEFRGILPGQAFACAWSRLPEGCGGTMHCRECTIRKAVARVHETGEAMRGVRAWLPSAEGCVEVRVSVEVEAALVTVKVERLVSSQAQA